MKSKRLFFARSRGSLEKFLKGDPATFSPGGVDIELFQLVTNTKQIRENETPTPPYIELRVNMVIML